jgi:hypothetical protein
VGDNFRVEESGVDLSKFHHLKKSKEMDESIGFVGKQLSKLYAMTGAGDEQCNFPTCDGL